MDILGQLIQNGLCLLSLSDLPWLTITFCLRGLYIQSSSNPNPGRGTQCPPKRRPRCLPADVIIWKCVRSYVNVWVSSYTHLILCHLCALHASCAEISSQSPLPQPEDETNDHLKLGSGRPFLPPLPQHSAVFSAP